MPQHFQRPQPSAGLSRVACVGVVVMVLLFVLLLVVALLLVLVLLVLLVLLMVYVDMGLASNAPIMLTSVTSGASFSRSFSIKVTQIDCYSLSKGNKYRATYTKLIKIVSLLLIYDDNVLILLTIVDK